MKKKTITIFAGDDDNLILDDIIREGIEFFFYDSSEEFKEDYPNDEPTEYEVTVSIKRKE